MHERILALLQPHAGVRDVGARGAQDSSTQEEAIALALNHVCTHADKPQRTCQRLWKVRT